MNTVFQGASYLTGDELNRRRPADDNHRTEQPVAVDTAPDGVLAAGEYVPDPAPRQAEPIRQYGDPVLRAKAKPVRQVNASVRALAVRMAEAMYAANGVGLAAPQIGESRRLVVLDVGDGLVTLINPRIIHVEGSEVEEEACLSVQGLCGPVERYARVLVRAKGLDGKELTLEGEGLLGRALQHELDHLDGVLFVDRAKELTPLGAADGLSVILVGTPAFAVPCLEALAASHHSLELVVTSPDRRSGRGLALKPSPVKEAAMRLGVPIETIEPDDAAGLQMLVEARRPDVLLVVAWGGLLTEACLSGASVAALNIHASLLPRWRGAAPIERAIMAGDRVTGVTIMYMAAQLDAGDIVLQYQVELPEASTGGEMAVRLATAGAAAVVQALDMLAAGEAPRVRQEPALVTWAPKLEPDDERISWQMPAHEIVNRVRALAPRPGAYFLTNGGRVKVLAARVHRPAVDHFEPSASGVVIPAHAAGTIVERGQGTFRVATALGSVWIDSVQAAGSRIVDGAAFLDGRRLAAGESLGEGGA